MNVKRDQSDEQSKVIGRYGGGRFVFTHRDPKTGKYWAESMIGSADFKGAWVPGDAIEFK